mgnify:CR=1 FL=1
MVVYLLRWQILCLGVTGASVGAAVATLNFSMNFIKNVHSEERIYVKSTIRHHGRTTMVIEAEMYDEEHHTLMATILTTMFIVGRFKEIPEKW